MGDPFKDTSGPSLNILIKLCSTVSIVFSGLITSIHLLGENPDLSARHAKTCRAFFYIVTIWKIILDKLYPK